MQVTFVSDPPARVHADIFVIGFFEDLRPLKGLAAQVDWLAGGALSRLIVGGRVSGKLSETTLMTLDTFSTPKILFVGLGASTAYTFKTLHRVAGALIPLLAGLHIGRAALELLGVRVRGLDPVIAARTFVKAWHEEVPGRGIDVTFVVPKPDQPRQLEQRLREMGI